VRDCGLERINTSTPWAMEMIAISIEEPTLLIQNLTMGILGCGGWVLSHSADTAGIASMFLEFERRACVEVYSVFIAAGVEFGQDGHARFTQLCQCTRSHQPDCSTEIASIDLEIQTFPARTGYTSRASTAI
jgi:hypothetical protein